MPCIMTNEEILAMRRYNRARWVADMAAMVAATSRDMTSLPPSVEESPSSSLSSLTSLASTLDEMTLIGDSDDEPLPPLGPGEPDTPSLRPQRPIGFEREQARRANSIAPQSFQGAVGREKRESEVTSEATRAPRLPQESSYDHMNEGEGTPLAAARLPSPMPAPGSTPAPVVRLPVARAQWTGMTYVPRNSNLQAEIEEGRGVAQWQQERDRREFQRRWDNRKPDMDSDEFDHCWRE